MSNIDVYVMVHNEEKMLPYFLRHYGRFARSIFAFEDQSTDRSREILESHPRVTVIEPEIHGIDEKYWTETLWPLYEQLSRGLADWVMLVDADEFIYHHDLVNLLRAEKAAGVQLIDCRGYTMVADHFPTTEGQIYDEVKLGLRDRMSDKSVVLDPAIHVRYKYGLHSLRSLSSNVIRKKNSGVKLLHYRYMGEQYFEEKDMKNRERFNMASDMKIPYSRNNRYRQPDGTRGVRLDWYAIHKDEAYNVVDL